MKKSACFLAAVKGTWCLVSSLPDGDIHTGAVGLNSRCPGLDVLHVNWRLRRRNSLVLGSLALFYLTRVNCI